VNRSHGPVYGPKTATVTAPLGENLEGFGSSSLSTPIATRASTKPTQVSRLAQLSLLDISLGRQGVDYLYGALTKQLSIVADDQGFAMTSEAREIAS
jgi:hypothetical protein